MCADGGNPSDETGASADAAGELDCIALAIDAAVVALVGAGCSDESMRWALAAQLTEARLVLEDMRKSPVPGWIRPSALGPPDDGRMRERASQLTEAR